MSMATAGRSVYCGSHPTDCTLTVHARGGPGRAEVENFIRHVYADRFGAWLEAFAPQLVALRDGGVIVAAAGYRGAAGGPLFLETYLPRSADQLLSAQAGRAVERHRIVEVGHLASNRAGMGRQLILLLGPLLAAEGFQWVVGTLTQELRRLLVRIGVAPLSLGAADPARLGGAAKHWGSYYEHHPVVLAGFLPQAMRHLRRYARATEAAGAAA